MDRIYIALFETFKALYNFAIWSHFTFFFSIREGISIFHALNGWRIDWQVYAQVLYSIRHIAFNNVFLVLVQVTNSYT